VVSPGLLVVNIHACTSNPSLFANGVKRFNNIGSAPVFNKTASKPYAFNFLKCAVYAESVFLFPTVIQLQYLNFETDSSVTSALLGSGCPSPFCFKVQDVAINKSTKKPTLNLFITILFFNVFTIFSYY